MKYSILLIGLLSPIFALAQDANSNTGKEIARQYCASCHGINGATAKLSIPFISGLHVEYISNALLGHIGASHKSFARLKQLTPEQIKQSANYYAALDSPWRGAGVGVQSSSFVPQTADIAAGEQLAARCNSCHGEQGNSHTHTDAPSLAAMPPQYFVASLKSYFSRQRQHHIMKMFGLNNALSARDIQQLAAYYAVQTPQKIRNRHVGRAAKNMAKVKSCEICHGPNGNSLIASLPNLTGQPAEYLALSMRAYRDGKRRHRAMQTALRKLNDRDIDDIAAYYANLEPVVATGWHKPSTDTAHLLAEGKKLAQMCDVCHGKNGNSTTPGMPKLTGLSAQYLANASIAYRNGGWQHELMQALTALLSDEEIEKLSLHYAAQQPVAITPAVSLDLVTGKKVRAACVVCHNETAQAQDTRIPNLNGQDQQYLMHAMQAYAHGKRRHDDMQHIARTLSAQAQSNLFNVTGYFASQSAPTPTPPRTYPSLLAQCQHCHGAKGEYVTDIMPRLSGQVEGYLVSKLKNYQLAPQNHMAHALNLSRIEIAALAAYFAKH